MALTHLLLLIPLLQQPGPREGVETGEVGKFKWPPATERTLRYRATFTKERLLPKDIAKSEHAARKAAKLYAPRRPPKRRVEMSMDITLAVKKDVVDGTYATHLGKQTLRLDVVKPKNKRRPADADAPPKEVPFLGNDRIAAVWGLPENKGDKTLQVPLAALERSFHHMFYKHEKKGTQPSDLRLRFGDHLLPVVWNYPLPCWIGELVNTMDLGGEAVIEGKKLIRDGTQSVKLGYRNTRVELKWIQAAASHFTMTYKLKVEQYVSEQRDGKPLEGDSFQWIFDIEGEARYSFREQAWDSIVEKITARPKEIEPAKMKALWDEVFVGTIEIKRTGSSRPRKKRRR